MLKKFDVDIPELDDNAMYDINDFIRNFHHLGKGLTFDETIDFFIKKDIIPKDKVMEFVRENPQEMGEMKFMIFEDFLINNIDIKVFNSSKEDLDIYAKNYREKYPEKYQRALERIIENREINYNYFDESIKRLKEKAITYLSLIQFIGNNTEEQKEQYYWQNLLRELDINFDGTKIMGEDIKRLLKALFNCQTCLEEQIKISNDLETYKGSYLRAYGLIAAKLGSSEFYPSSNILEAYNDIPISISFDGTSLKMSKRQYEEAKADTIKKQKGL